jgi:hypothetical protein
MNWSMPTTLDVGNGSCCQWSYAEGGCAGAWGEHKILRYRKRDQLSLERAVRQAIRDCDILVLSGGTSAG